jgi:hypothetical protein
MRLIIAICMTLFFNVTYAEQVNFNVGFGEVVDSLLNKLSPVVKDGSSQSANSGEELKPEQVRQKIIKIYSLTPSHIVEPTFAKNIWAIRSQNGARFFIDEKLEATLNNGPKNIKNWASRLSKQEQTPLAEVEQKQRFQGVYQAAINETFKIAIGSPSDGAMIMASAIDCPACLHIEKELSKRKVSYYVSPSFLDSNNKKFSKNSYCATAQAKVWKAYMLRETNVPLSNNDDCNYPEVEIKDFSAMLGGSTPTAIFPDGTILVGIGPIFKKLGLN